jgi:hypothetical protein
MDFELKELLQALGSNAALIFAAWIFLSFLQQRYSAAYDRYRTLIQNYRDGDRGSAHARDLHGQVVLYRQRCEQMRRATNVGIWAAILIISGLLAGGLAMIVGENTILKALGAGGVMVGLILVIAAAVYVLRENALIVQVMDSEPADVPQLKQALRAHPGD